MKNIENCIHTNENLWEFLVILNNSKNFKVIVNLGTLAYWLIFAYFKEKCLSVQISCQMWKCLKILIIISLYRHQASNTHHEHHIILLYWLPVSHQVNFVTRCAFWTNGNVWNEVPFGQLKFTQSFH